LGIVVASMQGLTAQSSTAPPEFEVASIKRNARDPIPGEAFTAIGTPPGRLVLISATVRGLISVAYQLGNVERVLKAPEWTERESFDINAKIPAGAANPQRWPMLRSLLAERFKLVAHTEPREVPGYALALARTDGRLGPRLRRPLTDCDAARGAARQSGQGTTQSPTASSNSPDRPACGIQQPSGGVVNAGGVPIRILTQILSGRLGRPVVDKTGLTGNFDIQLTFSPESLRPVPPAPSGLASLTSDQPSILSGLQDQLGVKLTSTKAFVDYLVIDHVERPTPD
jgi:uncharacterized protein (TIGR03435 family)